MTRYIAPIARVRMKNDEYLSGDRLLRFVSVTLGEDQRSSNCRFEVYDPDLKIADKYFKISFDQGGIEVPADLLEDPKARSPGGGGAAAAGATLSGGSLANADEAVRSILAECAKQGVTDLNQIAYILATAQHESDQFATLEEYASGDDYEGRDDLGNTQSGDGRESVK
jgi:hypothetical protein